MKIIHVVGKKNQGKTALVVALVEALCARGVRTGTLKHCHKDHELDTPGKDSHKHRIAGACTVAAVTPGLTAVFQQRTGPYDIYDTLRADFGGCDIVIVEGDAKGPGPKMEVWRAELGVPPLAAERTDIGAVVTDDAEALRAIYQPPLLLARSDMAALADHALAAAEEI